jgi:glycosyltransferase involved in cell wall biosynthesis
MASNNKSDFPLVSAGIPVYNGQKYLRHALDSLLAQDYPHLQIVISDNASTDGTAEICREYAARDPRISYVRQSENCGAIENFNRVFELSRGEFFCWVSDDDRREPQFISRCVEKLLAHPDAALCHTYFNHIDDTGQIVARHCTPWEVTSHRVERRLRQAMTSRVPYLESGIYGLFRRRALQEVMPIGFYFASDAVLLMGVALRGPILQVREPLFSYRVRPQTTLNDYFRFLEDRLQMRVGWKRYATRAIYSWYFLRDIARLSQPPFLKMRLLLQALLILVFNRIMVDEIIRVSLLIVGPQRAQAIAARSGVWPLLRRLIYRK